MNMRVLRAFQDILRILKIFLSGSLRFFFLKYEPEDPEDPEGFSGYPEDL